MLCTVQADRHDPVASLDVAVEARVGEVLRRLRRQRGLSLKEVAEGAGLSASFLGAVERGDSDIALGRLAQVARFYGHDVASLLGYSGSRARPLIVSAGEHVRLDRGDGVEFSAIRVPGTTTELMMAVFQPGSGFEDVVTHAGIDVMLVADGEIVLVFDGADYPLREGECAIWPSSHSHTVRNDSGRPARVIGFTTEAPY